MAILVRGGIAEEFDIDKLLPREWAVCTDDMTIWMCFSPGVVKKMGTYDDMTNQIKATSTEIAELYKQEFLAIEESIKSMYNTIRANHQQIILYYPEMKKWHKETEENAEIAKDSAEKAQTALNQAGWGVFEIDEKGHLIYFMTDYNIIDFQLNNGRLEVVWE